jgi:hypothetical protein
MNANSLLHGVCRCSNSRRSIRQNHMRAASGDRSRAARVASLSSRQAVRQTGSARRNRLWKKRALHEAGETSQPASSIRIQEEIGRRWRWAAGRQRAPPIASIACFAHCSLAGPTEENCWTLNPSVLPNVLCCRRPYVQKL